MKILEKNPNKYYSVDNLVKIIKINKSTIRLQISKLVRWGLVVSIFQGEKKLYRAAGDSHK